MMIYLDNSATTRPSEKAVAAMEQALTQCWGNPSSLHCAGLDAEHLLTAARKQVLCAMGFADAKPAQLVFTASGTEADNMALCGVAHAKQSRRGGRIIISDSEHPAVEQPARQLEQEGFEVIRIPTVGGVFDMDCYRRVLSESKKPFLVSCMLVNNETGAVNDIAAIGAAARRENPDVVIHTDAVQGFLKLPRPLSATGADLITVSAHKVHGPKGVGALYLSANVLKGKHLAPVIFGGGQEQNFRSGTYNLPGIAGFGAAAAEGAEEMRQRLQTIVQLRRHFTQQLAATPALHEICINEPKNGQCAPHIISITLPYIKSNTALNALSARGICVSAGSACAANSGKVSHTLQAFGLDRDQADSTLRISLSHENTKEELDTLLDALASMLQTLVRFRSK